MVTRYHNGGWEVSIDRETGDKVRRLVDKGNPLPIFPESMDLKVTDYCNAGCAFCHENSTVRGEHADLEKTQEALSDLPAGVEIAIGGGDPLSWPHLDEFLKWCANRGLFANITVNGLHIRRKGTMRRLGDLQSSGLLHGIGVSAVTTGFLSDDFGAEDMKEYGLKHVVGHLILGRANLSRGRYERSHDEADQLMPSYLILGFKNFGRGVAFKEQHRNGTEPNVRDLRQWLLAMRAAGVRVSFDNLALEQGRVQGLIDPSAWRSMYMGPDGMFTMFVDAVRQEWSVSSTTPRPDRISWRQESLKEFFAKATSAHA